MGGKCLQVADTITRVVECISNPNKIHKYTVCCKNLSTATELMHGYKEASVQIKIVGVLKSKFTVKSWKSI